MQSYTSATDYQINDQSQVMVVTNRCRYFVFIDEEEGIAILKGPGVEEEINLDEHEWPAFDSVEDRAIHFVMLFESGVL